MIIRNKKITTNCNHEIIFDILLLPIEKNTQSTMQIDENPQVKEINSI